MPSRVRAPGSLLESLRTVRPGHVECEWHGGVLAVPAWPVEWRSVRAARSSLHALPPGHVELHVGRQRAERVPEVRRGALERLSGGRYFYQLHGLRAGYLERGARR